MSDLISGLIFAITVFGLHFPACGEHPNSRNEHGDKDIHYDFVLMQRCNPIRKAIVDRDREEVRGGGRIQLDHVGLAQAWTPQETMFAQISSMDEGKGFKVELKRAICFRP